MTAQTQTRRPGQKRTATEKVADGKARAAQQRDAKADRETKDGQKRCAAGRVRGDGSYAYGIVAKTRCPNPVHRPSAALCQKHEADWRAEAKKRAAAKAPAKATKRAAKPKDNVVSLDAVRDQLPAGVLAAKDDVPAEALAAFASPELAAKATAKRRAAKTPAKS